MTPIDLDVIRSKVKVTMKHSVISLFVRLGKSYEHISSYRLVAGEINGHLSTM